LGTRDLTTTTAMTVITLLAFKFVRDIHKREWVGFHTAATAAAADRSFSVSNHVRFFFSSILYATRTPCGDSVDKTEN
jgi:hypothetical protein